VEQDRETSYDWPTPANPRFVYMTHSATKYINMVDQLARNICRPNEISW